MIASADRELDEVLRIGRRASDVVLAVYRTAFTVELKGPNDPVTRADREANDLICRALEAAFPGDGILAEESVPEGHDAIRAIVERERVWFVDPLDGTREFADRNGEFAVMIGLAVRGSATLGVLVMPETGEALAGRVGTGAWIESRNGDRRELGRATRTSTIGATLIASRSHVDPAVQRIADCLGVAHVVACGSVGVKVARVVTGAADLYVHPGAGAKHWDTCAPEAVLVASGGRFTDATGRAFDYASADIRAKDGMIATSEPLFEAVLAATRAELGMDPRVPTEK